MTNKRTENSVIKLGLFVRKRNNFSFFRKGAALSCHLAGKK